MAKTSTLLHQYARIGALARLTELRTEIAAIERAFPDLAGRRGQRRRSAASPSATAYTDDGQTVGPDEPDTRNGRRRKPMTAAQRKAVSNRMRKYWASRKRAAKSTAS